MLLDVEVPISQPALQLSESAVSLHAMLSRTPTASSLFPTDHARATQGVQNRHKVQAYWPRPHGKSEATHHDDMRRFGAMRNRVSATPLYSESRTKHRSLRVQVEQRGAGASSGNLFMGFDFGTSGARVTVIDEAGDVFADGKQSYTEPPDPIDLPAMWKGTMFNLVKSVSPDVLSRITAISLDGTSATTLIVDATTGSPVFRPMMYNENCSQSLATIRDIAPPNHTVLSGSSTLSKLVFWWQSDARPPTAAASDVVMMHQADWLLSLLHGNLGITDYNNALKVGYDPELKDYPPWLKSQPYAPLLPKVVDPGAVVGTVTPAVSRTLGLPEACRVCAGTTDSIAAFLAAEVAEPGEAVTSLGSTVAVKLLSRTRVEDSRYGVYSHRLGDRWLVGGASNTGGAVLKQLFTDEQLREYSAGIDPATESPYHYYPLVRKGERFPEADPEKEPVLAPRPESDVEYLHGILESMARIEGQAYALLRRLGATPLTAVFTAGGGARNPQWRRIRERVLGVPVSEAGHTEAAYGAALLALYGSTGRTFLNTTPEEVPAKSTGALA